MTTVVVKYNAGNVRSICFALERLGINPVLSDNADIIASADRVVFPGVGEASSAMRYLTMHGIDQVIRNLTQPVLGVCLGLQLLAKRSEENNVNCLGIIPESVTKFSGENSKVPHIGWERVSGLKGALFKEVEEGSYLYFVHSYFVPLCESTVALAQSGERFSAAIKFNNFHAVQFHPEKSGEVGDKILRNFLAL